MKTLKPFFPVFIFSVAFFLFQGSASGKLQNNQGTKPAIIFDKDNRFDWIQTARVFLLDAYQPPFAPELEYDAEVFADAMVEMHANVLRLGTMGKYATIPGIRFSTHPDQGERDLLQETIEACRTRGIKVVAYISTGHRLAWSMITEDYPEYAHQSVPGGGPIRSHMYLGESHGTVCWMTPYREAYLDYVTHVVNNYDIDGIYFDAWFPNYFWTGMRLCYCDGCREGILRVAGIDMPYHENNNDYTADELAAIEKYHHWYLEEIIVVLQEVTRIVRAGNKDIPMISNINNPERMAGLHPVIINSMDAFLYERGHTILERAEGVALARSLGMHVWPYVGTYHNWPRLAWQGINYQQEIFTNLMYGGGSIIAQPTGYVDHSDNREYVRYPFGIIRDNEELLNGMESYPHVGVVFAYNSPPDHVHRSWHQGETNARSSTLGAFSVCMFNHVQVSSISEFVLDDPEKLARYNVIYLANIPYLSAERVSNLNNYVYNGGNLIASYATTLFDSSGSRQSRFGLEDLIKVRPFTPAGDTREIVENYWSMTGGPNDLYLLTTHEGERLLGKELHSRLFPLWIYEPVEVLPGARVLMNIVRGYDKQAVLPGIVLSEHGSGRVLYYSSALESLYNSDGPDLLDELLSKLVEVAGGPAPYKIDAPSSLISNLMVKDDKMVLHLTNWTGNKFEKPLRNEYYLAPVENVRLQIRIPENRNIRKVSMMVEADFSTSIRGQTLELVIPRINDYQGIVVELE
jgi:hypothetical protein